MLRRLVHLGIADDLSARDSKYIVLLNVVALLAIAQQVALIALVLALGLSLVVTCQVAAMTGYVATLVLSGRRRHAAARVVLAGSAVFVLTASAILIGPSGRVELYMFTSMVGSWLIFPTLRGAVVATLVQVAAQIVVFAVGRTYAPIAPLPPEWVSWFQGAMSAGAMLGIIGFSAWAHWQTGITDRQVESLLDNMLPRQIAARLRHGADPIADRFDEVTVLFADLADFTPRAEQVQARELVAVLDEVFSRFDALCDRYGLEKIKTIGDAYMVVGGAPEARPDHAEAVVSLALDMFAAIDVPITSPGAAPILPLKLRIGIHSGPVIAGVIGRRKFAYDLWGDTVNTASRMESHGVPGRIQVTDAVRNRTAERFRYEERGVITVKGKGEMPTWFVVGRKE